MNIDISMMNASKMEFTIDAFSGCESLKNLSLPNNNKISFLKASNSMFEECSNLTSINLQFLEGAFKLYKADKMFKGCTKLKELEFPIINSSLIENTEYMFSNCINIKNIDMGGIKGGKISIMNLMFYNCKKLMSLNIYNLNTKNVFNLKNIFEGVNRNINIIYNSNITGNDLQYEIDKKNSSNYLKNN